MLTEDFELLMTTIEIVPEPTSNHTMYRAMCGEKQVTAMTPGQALDLIEQMLIQPEDEAESTTLVIMQRFRPDSFFSGEQQGQIQRLMESFHEAVDTGQSLPSEQQQALENLADAELEAAIQRSRQFLSNQAASLPEFDHLLKFP